MSNTTLNVNEKLLNYIIDTSVNESDIAKRLREKTMTLEMARMQIAPEQGAFMGFIAQMIQAKSYLEIGVFTGYSMLHVVEAMGDDATATGCDLSKEWTDIAKGYWSEAKILAQIDLQLDKALFTLKKLKSHQFDLAFIDADKENYDAYYEECLRLLKPRGLLMIDNIFWGGAVIDESIQDIDTQAIRALNNKIQTDTRVKATMLTIGDGLMMVQKT
jgi:predicted O-methyltransferase YrrM